jgi:hypothetical protein
MNKSVSIKLLINKLTIKLKTTKKHSNKNHQSTIPVNLFIKIKEFLVDNLYGKDDFYLLLRDEILSFFFEKN